MGQDARPATDSQSKVGACALKDMNCFSTGTAGCCNVKGTSTSSLLCRAMIRESRSVPHCCTMPKVLLQVSRDSLSRKAFIASSTTLDCPQPENTWVQ